MIMRGNALLLLLYVLVFAVLIAALWGGVALH